MSLYADILSAGCADENEITKESDGTFTVTTFYIENLPLKGIPTRELALAITAALHIAYDKGSDSAGYS